RHGPNSAVAAPNLADSAEAPVSWKPRCETSASRSNDWACSSSLISSPDWSSCRPARIKAAKLVAVRAALPSRTAAVTANASRSSKFDDRSITCLVIRIRIASGDLGRVPSAQGQIAASQSLRLAGPMPQFDLGRQDYGDGSPVLWRKESLGGKNLVETNRP